MRAFQLYFNPKQKKDAFFEIFCYKPSVKEEEMLGDFFVVAQMKEANRKSKETIKKIVEEMKDWYYSNAKAGMEEAFKQALGRPKFDQFPWAGLSLVVFSVSPNLEVLFSKINDLKIFVFRNKEIFNLGDNPSFNSSAEKKFSNIMQGSLEPGDTIAVLNQELFQNLWEEMIFQSLKETTKPKELKKLLKEQKPFFRRVYGVLLFVFVKKPKAKIILPKLPKSGFSFISKTPEKIFSIYPVPEEIFKKTLVSIIILILLLLLGWILF